jgi:hypothetical protein
MPYYLQIQHAKFNFHGEKLGGGSMYFLQFGSVALAKNWKIFRSCNQEERWVGYCPD